MATSILTPPDSPEEVGEDTGAQNVLISMSTTFYPRKDPPTDLVIISSDNVFFSVHSRVLLFNSNNAFGGFLVQPGRNSFTVPESSKVFNLVLYAFYDLDPAHYTPTFEVLRGMLISLPQYGLPLEAPLARGKPIFNLLSGFAFTYPLEVYTLAAEHGLEHLAVDASGHLLTMPLHILSDELCLRMGSTYLRRLIFLHLGRTERLKALLRDAPSHEPTAECGAVDQMLKLKAAWREGTTSLCWDANAGTSVAIIHAILSPIADRLTCEDCKTATRERIRSLVVDWTMIKSTI
ncbi:hypothetical protein M408DRAFT_6496 [Serendipita vermifera MAFF 305830]|uniref:BTB domain-containing protein n=1 Tax=Serendipita vermifera MAFF 305830 TaxID=933852 RepID=A0A0C3B5R4_SERVB|nr:hypothetical protein M408DRAFT_6496 [Serendipita vermifera MAFF 305830]